MFTLSVTHQNASCVSLSSNKCVECISFLTKADFFKYFKSCIVHIHVNNPYLLACSLLLCLHSHIATFLSVLQTPVDHWNSVKPLAGLCIVYICTSVQACASLCVHEKSKTGPTRQCHSATTGKKLHREPLKSTVFATLHEILFYLIPRVLHSIPDCMCPRLC